MIPVNRIGYEVDSSTGLKVSAHIILSTQHVFSQLTDWRDKPEYILEQDLKDKCRDTLYEYVYGDIKQEVIRLKNAVTAQLGDGLSGDARLAIVRLENLLQGCRIDGSCEKVEVVTSSRREINSAWEEASLQSDSPPWAEPREVCPPITFRRAVPRPMPTPTERAYQSVPSNPADCSRDYATDMARAPSVVSAVEPVQERRPTRRNRANGTVRVAGSIVQAAAWAIANSSPYSGLVAPAPAAESEAYRNRARELDTLTGTGPSDPSGFSDAAMMAAVSARIADPEPAPRRRPRFI